MAQPPVQRMAEKLVEARGASCRTAYEMFRFYVTGLDLDTFKSEIESVTNLAIFRVLWSVGLNYEKEDAALKKWKELYFEHYPKEHRHQALFCPKH